MTLARPLGVLLAAAATLGPARGAAQRSPRPVAPVIVPGACPFACCHYGA